MIPIEKANNKQRNVFVPFSFQPISLLSFFKFQQKKKVPIVICRQTFVSIASRQALSPFYSLKSLGSTNFMYFGNVVLLRTLKLQIVKGSVGIMIIRVGKKLPGTKITRYFL